MKVYSQQSRPASATHLWLVGLGYTVGMWSANVRPEPLACTFCRPKKHLCPCGKFNPDPWRQSQTSSMKGISYSLMIHMAKVFKETSYKTSRSCTRRMKYIPNKHCTCFPASYRLRQSVKYIGVQPLINMSVVFMTYIYYVHYFLKRLLTILYFSMMILVLWMVQSRIVRIRHREHKLCKVAFFFSVCLCVCMQIKRSL